MYIPLFVKENINLEAITDSIYDSLSPSSIVSTIYNSAYDFETDEYGNSLDKRDTTTNNIKSQWNKCMDKKYCKIGLIVGLCIGGLIVLWILSMIIQIICCGFKCVEALCCCCTSCCRGGCCNSRGYTRAAPPPPPVEKVHDYPRNYNHQQRYYV